ncbi:serine hydrolase [Pseudochryseolinea flava]|uniref:Glycosyl hydrolase n=1 Tax=Pseudochryseolinea flava TaxID=2059302 RepID=A0A364XYN2_9BACT|nr:serine hydrolase [Pseudochryseolinea flava]RAV99390.1 glycosyl hydrolase [Pseudochryseolinea flava]
MRKFLGCLVLTVSIAQVAWAQAEKDRWVDSVLATMNMSDKIGQLMMIRIDDKPASLEFATARIKNNKVGGIYFTAGHPVAITEAVNKLQEISDVPLFIGVDTRFGLVLDSTIHYPTPTALGAIRNDSMLHALGEDIGRQVKIIGGNLVFSPIANVLQAGDSASIISFGENRFRVSHKANAFFNGLNKRRVIVCATDFPIQSVNIQDIARGGIPQSRFRIDTLQTFAFKKLFERNVDGVMINPHEMPLFYSNVSLAKKNRFTSKAITSVLSGDWLKNDQNFKGLVFSNVPEQSNFGPKAKEGEAEMFAFVGHNDILITSEDVSPGIRRIRKLIRKEEVYEKQLDESVRKILSAKFDAGLTEKQPVATHDILARLNQPGLDLNEDLYQASITVARDIAKTLPIQQLDNRRFAYISLGENSSSRIFFDYLSKYVHVSKFVLGEKTEINALAASVKEHEVIFVSVFPETNDVLIERLKRLVALVSPDHRLVLCDFGNASMMRAADFFPTIITAYHNSDEMAKVVPEIIFGALKADGILPYTASKEVAEGNGIETKVLKRLSYSIPEDAGMDSKMLSKIDKIALEAVRSGATPGCQVLVARKGKVVYEKSFGYLRYDSATSVSSETIYDLASLTKVSATLQAVMFMQEKGLIDVNKKLSYYLPELKKTNKKDLTLVDLLTHQGGLVPFIPLWNQTVKDTSYLPLFYSRAKSTEYPLQVAPNLFASPTIRDSVWTWIIHSKMAEKPPRTPYSYKYSDLGFMMMQFLSERLLNQPMDEFLRQNFYEPLGAYTMGYTPLLQFPAQTIAPTEDDKIYRKTLVLGTVHDERAAMMGGIAGHAGLFSNASDLAKLGQMLLQEGYYGGVRYYKPETVRLFTHKQFEKSRRGLGWDKPIQSDVSSPTSMYASTRTFGHTGFTGTCLWVDPEFELVYIFLSNRVYPDRSNKLVNNNIRSRIQDVVYQSIFKYCAYSP